MMASARLNSAFQNSKTTSIYGFRGKFEAPAHRAFEFPTHRVIVGWYGCNWWQKLQARFNELTALPQGWDGYKGQPVSFTCAMFAANLLERICIDSVSEPALVPGSDGTLQIEWHKNQFDIEIDVLGANNVVATRYDHLMDREEVVELQNDFSILVKWIEELASERVGLDAATA